MKINLKTVIPTIILIALCAILIIVNLIPKPAEPDTVYGLSGGNIVSLAKNSDPQKVISNGEILRATLVGETFVYSTPEGISTSSIDGTGEQVLLRPGTPLETPLTTLSTTLFIYLAGTEGSSHDEDSDEELAHDELAHDEQAHDEQAHDEQAHDEQAHDEQAHEEYKNSLKISSLNKKESPKILLDDTGEPYNIITYDANVNTEQIVFTTSDSQVFLYDSNTETTNMIDVKGTQAGFVSDDRIWVSQPTTKNEEGSFITVNIAGSGKGKKVEIEEGYETLTVISTQQIGNNQIIIANKTDSSGTRQLLFKAKLDFTNPEQLLNFTKLGLNSNKTILPYSKDTMLLDFRGTSSELLLTFELDLNGEVVRYDESVTDIFR